MKKLIVFNLLIFSMILFLCNSSYGETAAYPHFMNWSFNNSGGCDNSSYGGEIGDNDFQGYYKSTNNIPDYSVFWYQRNATFSNAEPTIYRMEYIYNFSLTQAGTFYHSWFIAYHTPSSCANGYATWAGLYTNGYNVDGTANNANYLSRHRITTNSVRKIKFNVTISIYPNATACGLTSGDTAYLDMSNQCVSINLSKPLYVGAGMAYNSAAGGGFYVNYTFLDDYPVLVKNYESPTPENNIRVNNDNILIINASCSPNSDMKIYFDTNEEPTTERASAANTGLLNWSILDGENYFSDDTYYYMFSCGDSDSDIRTLIIDSTPPSITLSPDSNINEDNMTILGVNSTLLINISVYDIFNISSGNATLKIDDAIIFHEDFDINAPSYGYYNLTNLAGFIFGDYVFTTSWDDLDGLNSNSKAIQFRYKDYPILANFTPLDNELELTVGDIRVFTANFNDSMPENLSYAWFKDGELQESTLNYFSYIVLSADTESPHNITIIASDLVNQSTEYFWTFTAKEDENTNINIDFDLTGLVGILAAFLLLAILVFMIWLSLKTQNAIFFWLAGLFCFIIGIFLYAIMPQNSLIHVWTSIFMVLLGIGIISYIFIPKR